MKIADVFLISGSDFRTDQTSITFRDWGIECYAQELHEGHVLPVSRKLFIPWVNIKFIEQVAS